MNGFLTVLAGFTAALLAVSAGALTIVPHVSKNVPYDTLRDFAPIKSVAGVNFTHVPYKGAPQAVTDLLGGRVN